jgi:adenylate cyclase
MVVPRLPWRGGRVALLPCAILLLGIGLSRLPWFAALDLEWLDMAFNVLRLAKVQEAQVAPPVVIVGFDQASISNSNKPFALMHDEFAAVLDGLRLGAARAVAVDIVFPAPNFDSLIPGSTQRLAQSLGRLRAHAPLVIGADPGNVTAARLYQAMAGADGRATLLVAADADGVLRRTDDRLGQDARRTPQLAATLAKKLQSAPVDGIVDFSFGAPFDYVTAATVIALAREGKASGLTALFEGKVVVVGVVLADQDRQRLPVPLAAWEAGRTVAGVVFQAQALRSMLHGRMIRELAWLGDILALVALGLVWMARTRLLKAGGLAWALALAAPAASALLLMQGIYMPITATMLVLLCAMAALCLHAFQHSHAERARIRAIFSGYISPAILDAIVSGELKNGVHSGRRELSFLFADMRGFTNYSAQRPPEQVIAYLNRYYRVITEVLHDHGGTIDKFSGDGVMVFFGAPKPSANPANDAIRAGAAMLAALDPLNDALRAEGDQPIAIGIGIACGTAVIGNVGSAERHDYTATGAAVNLAAHIQQHCKLLAFPMLVEQGAFDSAALDHGLRARFESIDAVLEKHGSVRLAGFTPARSAS